MKFTLNMLRELDSCGDYLRVFGNTFPESEYPNGADLNQEICAAHADKFDWGWAAERMLTYEGQRVFLDLRQSRKIADRHFGTGIERRAAVFGHVFDTMPQYRSERILEVAQTADERADARLIRDLRGFKADVEEAQRQLEYWTREVPRRARRIADAEEKVKGAEARQAVRRAARLTEELAEAEERVSRLRTEAEEMAKKVAELEAAKAAEPAPAETSADATVCA